MEKNTVDGKKSDIKIEHLKSEFMQIIRVGDLKLSLWKDGRCDSLPLWDQKMLSLVINANKKHEFSVTIMHSVIH